MRFSKILPTCLALLAALFIVVGCSDSDAQQEAAEQESAEEDAELDEEIDLAESDEDDPGTSLDAWVDTSGWVGLYVYAQDDTNDEAWENAAKSLAETADMDYTVDDLKTEILNDKGLKEDIYSLTFDGDTVTAYSEEGKTIFSHDYTYLTKVSEAIDEYDLYVYATPDDDADEYTYLAFTLPDDKHTVRHFYWRSGADDLTATSGTDYTGLTGAMVDSEQFDADPDAAISDLYTISEEDSEEDDEDASDNESDSGKES